MLLFLTAKKSSCKLKASKEGKGTMLSLGGVCLVIYNASLTSAPTTDLVQLKLHRLFFTGEASLTKQLAKNKFKVKLWETVKKMSTLG